MKKLKLPSKVTIGAFEVQLITIPHDISYEVSEAQGAFVGKPPYKIYLDDDIILSKIKKKKLLLILMGILLQNY